MTMKLTFPQSTTKHEKDLLNATLHARDRDPQTNWNDLQRYEICGLAMQPSPCVLFMLIAEADAFFANASSMQRKDRGAGRPSSANRCRCG